MYFKGAIAGNRMYFGPTDWIKAGGNHEKLGFLEFNSSADSIHLNPSMINFVGLPMTFQHKKAGQVLKESGCTSSNYQGVEQFQDLIKNHCPGKVQKLDSSTDLYYCSGTYTRDIEGTKVDSTWNLTDADIASSNLASVGCSAGDLGDTKTKSKENIGNCQPTKCLFYQDNKARVCADLNRGNNDDDASKFYTNPSPYDPTATDKKWQFNPYAAFVHMICGPSIYAFPTDDKGGHGGFFTAHADEEAVITLCPRAGSGPNSPGIMPASQMQNSNTNPTSVAPEATANDNGLDSGASTASSTDANGHVGVNGSTSTSTTSSVDNDTAVSSTTDADGLTDDSGSTSTTTSVSSMTDGNDSGDGSGSIDRTVTTASSTDSSKQTNSTASAEEYGASPNRDGNGYVLHI
jgi:hypothetical protein